MDVTLLFAMVIALLMIGVPIAISLGLSSVLFLLWFSDTSLASIAQTLMQAFVGHYTLLAIPFFILASSFMSTGGVAKRIIRFSIACVGHLRGGLGHGIAEGQVIGLGARIAMGLRQIEVARNVENLAFGRHRIWRFGRAVAVVDKPRDTAGHQRRIKPFGQPPRHGHRTGIPGRVTGQSVTRKAKILKTIGNIVRGMFADQHNRRASRGVNHLHNVCLFLILCIRHHASMTAKLSGDRALCQQNCENKISDAPRLLFL